MRSRNKEAPVMETPQGKRALRPDLGQSSPRRALLALSLLGLVSVIVLLLSACGPGSGSPKSSPGGSGTSQKLKYAACMRSHGEPNFPDPNSQGGFNPPSSVNMSSPQYAAAEKACQSLEGGGLSPARQARLDAGLLKFAACMRANGEAGYPDPTFGANGSVSQSIGKSDGVDPNSPQYAAAQKKCQHLQGG